MQDNICKKDLRVVKTTKMLDDAFFSLLDRHTFRRITVRDLCDEAQISRATFYARYADKYDFMKGWLVNLKPSGLDVSLSGDENWKIHNDNFIKNKQIIRNLVTDADLETLEILAGFFLNYFMLSDKYNLTQETPEQVVLSNFFAGGMIYYIRWQVKHKFPPDVKPVNVYLNELVKVFQDWELGAF